MKFLSLRNWVSKPSRLADRARDARDWTKAAKYYRIALQRSPSQPAIWVQYGHALKESGNLVEAEAAYRRSLELNGAVADSHLQLGHVLKLQGRKDEAACAYLRALLLVPWMQDAKAELKGLGWSDTDIDQVLLPNPVAVLNKSEVELYADALARNILKKMADVEGRLNRLDGEVRTISRRFHAAAAAIQDREAVLNRLRCIEELLTALPPSQRNMLATVPRVIPAIGENREHTSTTQMVSDGSRFVGEAAREPRNSRL